MRILWVDNDQNPWTEASGWQILEDFGLRLSRVNSVAEAKQKLNGLDFDVLLVRAELPDIAGLLVQARKLFQDSERKLVLASSEWSKEQFKVHSKTEGAAHRYARIPMPPNGFLSMMADLFDLTIEELSGFELVPVQTQVTKKSKAPKSEPVRSAPKAPRRSASADSQDIELVRKYLKVKEEQLEISESEKEELAIENERLQNEAHHLQMKMREFEHLNDEISRKVKQMEEDQDLLREDKKRIELEKERMEKSLEEKIKLLEEENGQAAENYENLRQRVRKDIRKIRENEKDLETRLELLRKDSETLLIARDSHVIDLQRKIDALEFDLDQLQDSRVQAQMEAERYLSKLAKVSRALQIAIGMIQDDPVMEDELQDLMPATKGGAALAQMESKENFAPPSTESKAATKSSELEEFPASAEPAQAAESSEELDDPFASLASEGEATQMVSTLTEDSGEEEPNSSSG